MPGCCRSIGSRVCRTTVRRTPRRSYCWCARAIRKTSGTGAISQSRGSLSSRRTRSLRRRARLDHRVRSTRHRRCAARMAWEGEALLSRAGAGGKSGDRRPLVDEKQFPKPDLATIKDFGGWPARRKRTSQMAACSTRSCRQIEVHRTQGNPFALSSACPEQCQRVKGLLRALRQAQRERRKSVVVPVLPGALLRLHPFFELLQIPPACAAETTRLSPTPAASAQFLSQCVRVVIRVEPAADPAVSCRKG